MVGLLSSGVSHNAVGANSDAFGAWGGDGWRAVALGAGCVVAGGVAAVDKTVVNVQRCGFASGGEAPELGDGGLVGHVAVLRCCVVDVCILRLAVGLV